MLWSAPCSTLTLFAQAPLPVRKRSLDTEEAKAQAALVGMKTVPKGYKVEVVPAEEEACRKCKKEICDLKKSLEDWRTMASSTAARDKNPVSYRRAPTATSGLQ